MGIESNGGDWSALLSDEHSPLTVERIFHQLDTPNVLEGIVCPDCLTACACIPTVEYKKAGVGVCPFDAHPTRYPCHMTALEA
jgi:hypothetical protein